MVVKQVMGAALVLGLWASVATAAPARIEQDAKVRSGPGTKYRIIATLRRGSIVDVSRCSGAWCEVGWLARASRSARASRGYVVNTTLAPAEAPVAAVVTTLPGAVAPLPATITPLPAVMTPVPAAMAPPPAVAAPVPAAAAPVPAFTDDYPGFDYRGYAYAPTGSVTASPRWKRYSGRWSWRYRRHTEWARRPAAPVVTVPVPLVGGAGSAVQPGAPATLMMR